MQTPKTQFKAKDSQLDDLVNSPKTELSRPIESVSLAETMLLSWKRDLNTLHNFKKFSNLTPEVASYVNGQIVMLQTCIDQLNSFT